MIDADELVEGPVTFVASREVKPDSIDQYEQWVEDLGKAARDLDSNFRMTVIKPSGAQAREYVLILHFSSQDKLDEWEQCDVRKDLLKRLRPMVEGKASFSEVTGFEYWFSLPKVAATKPPSRYKMALVTILGLYILSLGYTYTFDKWLDSLPDHAEVILKIVLLVALMTFVLMPLLTRLLARWLYPASSRSTDA